MHAILPNRVGDCELGFLMASLLEGLVISIQVVKPDFRLRRPRVSRAYFFERVVDASVAFLHGSDSIWTKRNPCTYLAKFRRLFVDFDVDASVIQSNG